MKKIKGIISILIIICLCVGMSSCGSKFTDKTIYFSTTASLTSLDPQLASTKAELTVAQNCFEGLLTLDENGKITDGLSESHSVSKDGLVYTFIIKDGLLWSDGETACTAQDFVFGIVRSLTKKTASPYASLLFSIKNARSFYNGNINVDKLGITSNENRVIITLEKKDSKFEQTLTKAVAAPCNKAFFEKTNGKYGLSKTNIITNGAYKISSFSTDEKNISLYRYSDYEGVSSATPLSIAINFSSEYEDIYSLFGDNDTDIADVECDYMNSLETQGNSSKLFYNTNYCLYISKELKTENGYSLAKSLVTDIDDNAIKTNLTGYYSDPFGVIPKSNTAYGKNYREAVGKIAPDSYNKKNALKLFGDYASSSEAVSGLAIYYPENIEKITLLTSLIAQGWQKDLNAYINTCPEKIANIESGIKSGEIKLAVIPVSSENNLAFKTVGYISSLGFCSKPNNYDIKSIKKFEQGLINNYILYPLVSIPEAISFDKKISNIMFSDDAKTIDLRYAKKDK